MVKALSEQFRFLFFPGNTRTPFLPSLEIYQTIKSGGEDKSVLVL